MTDWMHGGLTELQQYRTDPAAMPEPSPALPQLEPGAIIGILGGGQLGKMLALAAANLGLRCHILCPDPECPAFDVAARNFMAAYEDERALRDFASSVNLVTYEFENVPVTAIETISDLVPVRPGIQALEVAQDRLTEKSFLRDCGVPVCQFAPVVDSHSLARAAEIVGFPAILKTRRLGYDGKGQFRIESTGDAEGALHALRGQPAILEQFVPLSREVSVIGVADGSGTVKCYDVTENVHENHILHISQVPANVGIDTARKAVGLAELIARELDYIGVLGVEFFVVDADEGESLLVNEIAPRVHNSGHWTQDGCEYSQFENHIRAVAGWPIGSTERIADVMMTNLIGDEVADWRKAASEPGAHPHIYGKRESRTGRKMGHINRILRYL